MLNFLLMIMLMIIVYEHLEHWQNVAFVSFSCIDSFRIVYNRVTLFKKLYSGTSKKLDQDFINLSNVYWLYWLIIPITLCLTKSLD